MGQGIPNDQPTVFLSRENLKTRRLSKKLDNLYIGLFKIIKVKGLVIFKLQLPKGVQNYLVFYKKLLELVLPNILLYISLELKNKEYKVKVILDLQKIRYQQKYLVKQKGQLDSQNIQEPRLNLIDYKKLVQEYYKRYLEKKIRN